MKIMRKIRFAQASGVVAAGLGILTLMLSGPAQTKEPLNHAADFDKLMDAVAYGDQLWHTGTTDPKSKLSTNGLACANCHPDASATQPQSWPKFQSNLGKVGTMREMFNWCMQVPQQAKGFPLDSKEIIAMEAYATYMNRGQPLNPGLDAQTSPEVISGPGYPTNDEGNR
jgi:thiosulfate dehydrogenase